MKFLRLIFFLALILGIGAAGYAYFGGDGPFRREIAVTPEETRQAARSEQNGNGEAQVRVPPAFDIVRVEGTGEVVAAGTAPPGWRVQIATAERALGTVTAEFDGTWVFMPDTPLPAGEHSLSLRASAPDGSREVVGAQRVAVSVSGRQTPAVVAVSEDDKPTRVLQSGVTAATGSAEARAAGEDAEAQAEVAFSAVDYEDRQETGRLSMSGAAVPGARIALYLDNRFVGSAQADADGAWQFSITDVLEDGEHTLRADHVDMAQGDVLSRAEVRFDRTGVAIAEAQAGETRTALNQRLEAVGGSAASGTAETASRTETAAAGSGAARTRASASDTREPGFASPPGSEQLARSKAIVVRQGDTLWHIAEQIYGSGVRYTQIYRSNRDQIRNPHRIYPGQRFELPR